jgi:hypothetical protein
MMDWHPIETAPKDQTEVLVYAPTEKPSVFTAMCIDGDWSRSSAGILALRDEYFGDPDFRPTQWMQVPPAPL